MQSSDEPRPTYDHPSSIRALRTARHKRYQEDHNPIWLMKAFIEAHSYGRRVPGWVLDKIGQVFAEHLSTGISLDTLMGCAKGRGRASARADYYRRGRDVALALAVDVLRRPTEEGGGGMKIAHAVAVAQAYGRLLSRLPANDYRHIEAHIPTVQEVRENYYKWKPRLAPRFDRRGKHISGIVRYHDGCCADMIDLVLLADEIPAKLREKYPALFKLRSPDKTREKYHWLFPQS